jgi:ligand-binding sensor domain-containing protein
LPSFYQSVLLHSRNIRSILSILLLKRYFPSSYVETVLQDHDGFMWIGTSEGLCRYDGYSFFNLVNSPSDSYSLIDNGVTCLVEDKNHNLWVGTRNGLTYLDLTTYKFKWFSGKFRDWIGTCYCLVDDGKLLIGTILKGARKALILALKDSAEAFVLLLSKKFRIFR